MLCAVQVPPLSEVEKTVPTHAVQPVVEFVKKDPLNTSKVPDVCAIHVVPLSAVVRIVPLDPIAQPVVAFTKKTALNVFAVPDVCADHVCANAKFAGIKRKMATTI